MAAFPGDRIQTGSNSMAMLTNDIGPRILQFAVKFVF
jgi:hypothetical protein